MANKENYQKAGDNSKQIQANNIIVVNGIDEKRAREIAKEMFEIAKNDFTQEAITIANDRRQKFEDELISRIQKVEGAINSFSDPNFQVLLASANRTAIQTERQNDYEMLSELLLYRTQIGNDRNVSLGIKKAIEIIGDVSDEALLGVTIFYFTTYFFPLMPEIEEGLNLLENTLKDFLNTKLPEGVRWLDQLDILGAIRMRNFSHFKTYEELKIESLDGYVCTGIKIDSENYINAVKLLKRYGLEEMLRVHELNDQYARLYISQKDSIRNQDVIEHYKLTGEKQNVLEKVLNMYENNEDLLKENKEKFKEEMHKRENIKKLIDWFNSLKECFELTIVGKVLAHANCERIVKDIPKVDYNEII